MILHLYQKVSLCIFRSVFSGSAFLFMAFLIIVVFFLTSCFLSSLVQTHFVLSYSGLNFSPFCRPVFFQQLLIHCTLEGHACPKCFDNLQLFALKDLSRKIELHKLPAE